MDATTLTYAIVDTNQTTHYGTSAALSQIPSEGAAFYGQDALYAGNSPQYVDHGDGTITDQVTGLMWQKTPTWNVSYADAVAGAANATTGGYTDWRLPTIKELYSLIDFSGETGRTAETSTPYIDDDVFDFVYGDTAAGERFIDVQVWSSTEYVGTTMGGNSTTFGLNLADGRIKGYPNTGKLGEVMYVRGNADYGVNQFVDTGDGTVTDTATGLTWLQSDSGTAMTWAEALAWAEGLTVGGYDDWRLPNAKELQSLVDYTRAPDPTHPTADTVGPAIDPLFSLTNIGTADDPDYPYLWTSTTHVEGGAGRAAVYIAFGEALGWMQDPRTGSTTLMDVHGAGAQRSDFKAGDAEAYPYGHGPQGDLVRIENHAIAVRDTAVTEGGMGDETAGTVSQEVRALAVGLALAATDAVPAATDWEAALDLLAGGGDLQDLAAALCARSAFQNQFDGLSALEVKVAVILANLALTPGTTAHDLAMAYFTDTLTAGMDPARVLVDAVSYLLTDTARTAAFDEAAAALRARVDAALDALEGGAGTVPLVGTTAAGTDVDADALL